MTKKILISLSFLLFLFSPVFAESYIRVKVTNVSASVYIDGSYKGYSPVYVEVSPGTHSIKVERTGYKTYYGSTTVQDGYENTITVTLEEEYGTIYAKANIDGATVYVDGRYEGIVPTHAYNLKPGTHTVRFSKGNYDDVVYNVYVSAGQTTNVTAEFVGATLVANANEENVTVYIDNIKRGSAGTYPVTIRLIEPGYHTVEIYKKHYSSAIEKIYFKDGYIHTLTGYLEKMSGYLEVETEPENAAVTVSGNTISKLNGNRFEVNQGNCTVEAVAFGYQLKKEDFSVSKDKTIHAKIKLDEAEFDINSLTTSSPSFNPDNTKVLPNVRIAWYITAPETGVLTITNSEGVIVASWNVSFSDWSDSIVWDGKIDGVSVAEGVYNIQLEAGGKKKDTSVTVDKTIKNYLQVSRGLNEISFDFDFSFITSDFYSGKDFSLYYLGGDDHFYAGLGFDIYSVDYLTHGNYINTIFWNIDFKMGLCCNYFSFRPYVQGGIGYYAFTDSTAANQGLFLSMTLGFDVFSDNFQFGLFYSMKNFVGNSTASCIGVSLGYSPD